MHVGFIGLGIMGLPMARNLLRAGHTVTGFSRTRRRVEMLVADGGDAADNAADVARRVEALITCLPDSPDVEQVLLGSGAVFAAAAPGLLAIDMSTIAPSVARRLAVEASARGLAFLDAPVSGGDRGAIAGTLSIMVGGETAAVERARPLFEAMGKQITHMGAAGTGQMTKLVNQVVGACTLAAVAEGVQLAARAGLDPERVITAIGGGAASSWMWSNLGPRMQQDDFAPGFMVRLQQKDLRLAMVAAADVHTPLPVTSLVQQLLAAVEAHGGGDLGTQSIVTALRALAGS